MARPVEPQSACTCRQKGKRRAGRKGWEGRTSQGRSSPRLDGGQETTTDGIEGRLKPIGRAGVADEMYGRLVATDYHYMQGRVGETSADPRQRRAEVGFIDVRWGGPGRRVGRGGRVVILQFRTSNNYHGREVNTAPPGHSQTVADRKQGREGSGK